MSARDEILRHPGVLATADAEIAALLDAHRAEVLAEVDQLLVAERMKPRYGDIFRHGIEHARKAVAQMANGGSVPVPAVNEAAVLRGLLRAIECAALRGDLKAVRAALAAYSRDRRGGHRG